MYIKCINKEGNTMKFTNTLQQRYTTKMYDNSKAISPTIIEELKEVLQLSPSSINSQPWKFIFVQNQQIKQKLSEASLFNNEKVLNCDTLVVFTRVDNIPMFENDIAQRLPERTNEYYNLHLKTLPENEIKNWFAKQVYLSLGVFLSACATMEIDSTTMEGIETNMFDEILELKDYTTLFAVAIGYRDNDDFNTIDKVAKTRKELNEIITQK